MTMKKVFASLAGKVRRFTGKFREKPQIQIDDYALEHFLLYNGLIGSTPDNQREYRDVRNDIVQAVNDLSAHELAIALKLPPLWWETRLEKIFAEIATINREGAVACLSAPRPIDDFTGDTTPLSHSNWQVRANAARMLAFLDAKQAITRLVEMLNECQDDRKPAFCHVAYSLARLGTDQARKALVPHIDSNEPWSSVDATGALAHWNLPAVAADLMKAMLSGNQMDDYMAVSIARHHSPSEIAEFQDEEIQEGCAELVMALIKGLEGPFHSEHNLNLQLVEVSARINDLALQNPTPRRLAAAIALNQWLEEEGHSANTANKRIRDLSDSAHYESVKNVLTKGSIDNPAEIGQLKHALALSAQYKLTGLTPHLTPLLDKDSPALLEVMNCMAALGVVDAAPRIAKLIEEKVNLSERCALPLSTHPVVEQDKTSTDIYWSALKALGSLPHKSSLDVLKKAANDYAPDKREQALLSLQTVLLTEEMKVSFDESLQDLIKERTDDPSVAVQTAALQGIAQHNLTGLLPEVLKSLQSRETAVQRKAAQTLVELAASGKKDEVKQSIEITLSKEFDSGKKHRLSKVLHSIENI